MGTFSAVGVSPDFFVVPGNSLLVTITNTFVATVVIERRISGGYVPLYTITGDQVVALPIDGTFRLNCTDYTSGTVTYALASQAPANPYLPPGGTTGQALEKTSNAPGVADWETLPSASGLFGGKTIVVSTTGSDAAGTASKYGAEFKTIGAALALAATSDCVIVRPGSYSPAAMLVPPHTGIAIYFMPGAVVNGLAESPIFYDGGSPLGIRISGHGVFKPGSGGGFVELDAASDFYADGMKIYAPTTGTGTLALIQMGGAGPNNVRVTMRDIVCANNMLDCGNTPTEAVIKADTFAVTQVLVNIGGGAAHNIAVEGSEASGAIVAGQILVDSGSTGATRVSITAPSITATVVGNDGVHIDNASTGRYEIDAPLLVCPITFRPTNAACQLHVTTKDHTSQAGSGTSPLSLQHVGETFYRCDDCLGIIGAAAPIYMQDTATLHLFSGRIRGLDGSASGHAILTSGAGPKLRLYPGAVLIAGNDMATESINADNTPTVLAMGAIAVNKAANVGVVVAVGSLLVDAAVV